jgi:hypothetical protein
MTVGLLIQLTICDSILVHLSIFAARVVCWNIPEPSLHCFQIPFHEVIKAFKILSSPTNLFTIVSAVEMIRSSDTYRSLHAKTSTLPKIYHNYFFQSLTSVPQYLSKSYPFLHLYIKIYKDYWEPATLLEFSTCSHQLHLTILVTRTKSNNFPFVIIRQNFMNKTLMSA